MCLLGICISSVEISLGLLPIFQLGCLLLYCWVVWAVEELSLLATEIELPYDPAVPLQGMYLDKNMIWKDTCTPMFNALLCTIAKTWKKPKCPSTDEWINKMWYIYYNGVLLSHEKEWTNAICSPMDRPRECCTEWSKLEKEKYHMTSIYVESKKKWYKWTYKIERDSQT